MLIATVFTDHQNSEKWARLQHLFVEQTTAGGHHHVAVYNGIDPSISQHISPITTVLRRTSHLDCLGIILDYFRQATDDSFLILDSDCWPIKKGWARILDVMLAGRLYAAPVRTENFDLFPHPCAFYMRKEMLPHVNFDFVPQPNLMGYTTADVGSAMPTKLAGRPIWLPLIRTNRWNPHPLASAIYGHLFYHHGGGSRGAAFRSLQYEVFGHFMSRAEHRTLYDELTVQLLAKPRQFINRLCSGGHGPQK